MESFDIFLVDPNSATKLLFDHYRALDFRWRWNDSQNTGISVRVLDDLVNTGHLEKKYIPILYRQVFGNRSPEEIERGFVRNVKYR